MRTRMDHVTLLLLDLWQKRHSAILLAILDMIVFTS